MNIIKEPEPKRSCDHCGAPLADPIHVGHHVFEEIANPKPRQAIDYLEFEYRCVTCNSCTQSKHSDCPPNGAFGKNALIQTTLMKFEEGGRLGKYLSRWKPVWSAADGGFSFWHHPKSEQIS